MKKLALLFFLFSLTSYGQLTKRKLDSLFNYKNLDSAQLSGRCFQLGCIAREFKGSNDSAKLILDRAYEIVSKIKNDGLRMRLNECAVVIKVKNKDFAEAYDFAIKCTKVGDKSKDPKVRVFSRDPLMRFYSLLSSQKKLCDVYREKIGIARELNDSTAIALTSYYLGYSLYIQKEYKQARKSFLDAYNFSTAVQKKQSGVAEYIGWVGNISNILNDHHKAVSYRLMAVRILQNSTLKEPQNQIATSYRFIGSFYAGRKMLDSALYYYKLSMKINEQAVNKTGPGFESFDIARGLYTSLNNPKLAEPFITGVLDNKKINPYTDVYYWSTELGMKIYADLHKLDRLAYCSKWYFKIKDSIDKPQEVVAEDISMKYELEMQQKEKKAIAVRELEKRKSEIFKRNLFGGFALIALVLLLLVYRNFRQKKKAHKEISVQKILLEVKQKEIVDSINYASRIQQSQLPTERYIGKSISRLKRN
ncbi:MAG TPA: hypothetical protein VK177_08905 [Flavobacteriales bacterium]|nr:hypothetical protein [Flavobacteriales bacterium]